MIEIKHLATTKLQNDQSRLTFEIESSGHTDFECELIVDLRWIFGSLQKILVKEYRLQKDAFKETFHIDVNTKIARKSSRFNWQLIGFVAFYGKYSIIKGKRKIIKTS